MKRASVAIGLLAILIAGGSVAWIGYRARTRAEDAPRGRRPEPTKRPAARNRSQSGSEEPARVAGTPVSVRQGMQPVPGARVQLLGASPERGSFIETERAFVPLAERVADRNGDLLLPCHGKGPWVARATANGLLSGTVWITNPDGGHVIRLEPGKEYGLQVVDDSDSPISGAEILVYPLRCQGPPRMTYTTDATGRANMVLGKEEDLVIHRTGFAWKFVEHNGRVPKVVLDPGFRLGGTVVDSTGAAIAGARLVTPRFFLQQRTVTDAQGTFLIEGVAAEQLSIEIRAEGFQSLSEDVWPGDESMRLVLAAFGRVSGTVVFDDGRPATGVRFGLGRDMIKTDREGRFSGIGHAGECELKAHWGPKSKRATHEARARYTLAPHGRVEGLRLILRPYSDKYTKGYLRVRTVDAKGRPVEGMVVKPNANQATTGPDGRVLLEVRQKTPRVVFVRARQPLRFEMTRVIEAGRSGQNLTPLLGFAKATPRPTAEGPEITIVVRRAERVELRVRDEQGKKLPKGSILYVEIFGAWRLETNGSDSVWLVYCDRRHPSTLTVRARGYRSREIRNWTPTPPVFDLRLQRGRSISGRVVDRNGAPRAGVSVSGFWGRNGFSTTKADTDGRFGLAGLERASILLLVGGSPTPVASRRVQAEDDIDIGEIVAPDRAPFVEGICIADGRPVGGVQLSIPEIPRRGMTTVSRADGHFRIRVPVGFDGLLVPQKRGLAAYAVRAEKGPLRIELLPGRRLRYRLGGPWWSHAARVRQPSEKLTWKPSKSDTLQLEDLPPLPLVLVLVGADGRRIEREVDLATFTGTLEIPNPR